MPIVYMLIGLPGSGKSTYAKKLAKEKNAVIISTDKIREEVFGDEAIQENEQYDSSHIFSIVDNRVKLAMLDGKNIIFDATNINRKRRKVFLENISKSRFMALRNTNYEYSYIAVVIATPYEKCLQNNLMRKRVVPEEVIKRMMTNFEVPIYNEGWDKIEVVNPFRNWAPSGYIAYSDYLYDNCAIPHDCEPWHTGTIGNHLWKVRELIQLDLIQGIDKQFTTFYRIVGSFHDIGKPYVKAYSPKKGRCTYYNHGNVSAYLFCCCQPTSFSLQKAFIIEKHMEAHQYNSDDECRAALSKNWIYDPEDIELIIKFGKYDNAGALAVEGTVLR